MGILPCQAVPKWAIYIHRLQQKGMGQMVDEHGYGRFRKFPVEVGFADNGKRRNPIGGKNRDGSLLLYWKGKRGTAMAANPALQSALMESCQLLGAAGKLRFWKFALNGKPIAIMHAIVEGDQAWLCKIAYDENYAKFSPGVLLILYATEKLFAERGITLVDSCAIPGHPMIENIWRDRVEMADVMIAPKSISARRFALTVATEKLRRSVRGFVRDTCYYLKAKRRS